jgi:hypothetical protein
VGVTLAWQFAFFAIATDPMRFRPLVIPSIFEKLTYVVAMVVLYLQNRITDIQLSVGAPNALLCLLFVIVFFQTRPDVVSKTKESNIFGGIR